MCAAREKVPRGSGSVEEATPDVDPEQWKHAMGPPRLTVVEGNGPIDPSKALPANDAAPVEATGQERAHPPGSGSPVHDLISSIESGDPGAGSMRERKEKLRILEAVIFAAAEPVDEARLATYLQAGDDTASLLGDLQAAYRGHGVNRVKVGDRWALRTAEDLSWALERHARQERRLSKAALETLAIVAYHQPVTRAEIEEVRGVTISKGT